MTQITRWRVSTLQHGQNIRSDLGPEPDLRRLGKSLRKRQQQPLLIRPDGTVIDGHRRLAAALLEGIEELDCIVISEDATPAEIERIQLISAVHRADLPPYDKAVGMRAIKATSPGLTNRQLAEDELHIDPATVTKTLSLWDCLPEVQDAARAGKLGITDWYAIHRAPDQLAALAKALDGATRADLEREGKRQRQGGNGQPAVRAARIKCPLPSGVVITASGQDMTLEEFIESLGAALKEARKALEQGLDGKTFSAVARDKAKAGG